MTFDTQSNIDYMMEKLRQKSSWANILEYSTNKRIIEVVAEMAAQLASYDEFLTRNTKWDLATEKSALISQSQFMQYDAYRKQGATGYIRISSDEDFSDTYSKIIEIPKYTVFSDGDEIQFSTIQSENLLTTDNYLDIPVVQGEPKTYTYIAQGNDYEEISIENSNIENFYYELEVNGETWTETSDLNANDKDDKVYQLENTLNFDGIIITFGNNIFGKKLSQGDSINFKYIETLGIDGNISSADIVTTVESTIYDIDGDQVEMFCKNTDRLDGGKDEEDIEDIRTNGTDTFQAGDKAVAEKDYEVRLERESNILKAIVWGAYEYNIDNNYDLWNWIETQSNLVNVSAITPAGEQLTDSQKETVIENIKPDKPPTDILKFWDAEFIYLAWHIDIYADDRSYVLSEIKSNTITGISDRYSLENIEFNQNIYETEWKGYINTIDGVTFHTSYIEMIQYMTFSSEYAGSTTLHIYPIEPETVKLYIIDTTDSDDTYSYMGMDDGEGSFISASPYDLTGSSIDYETGALIVDVVAGLSEPYEDYKIKVYYQTSNNNLCPTARNQIFKIEEITDVTAQYTTEDSCSA